MQAAKIIDIKRSFVPVDPNTFPETMHLDNKEDSPETRVPVVPYLGHNFLPTAHGYKSFFGDNSRLDFFTLLPNKADHIFTFQTLAYKNVVIALCDTGIWAKAGNTDGGWVAMAGMAIPAEDAYYEWTWAVVSNKLYIFRSNNDKFHEIETDIVQLLGITINEKIPNFITPTAQLGMFKLGSRLGFWDAENAIAWSSPDDFTDFTPSVMTGANVTTFNSIKGKISAIRSHGKDVLAYSSKGIVHLAVQPTDTFLVKATPVLDGVGVPYSRQSCEGVPNNTHFAYSTGGIYKIENGKPEVIIPEVFDYFKPYNQKPVYLQLLEGRYLAFEIMDANAVDGNPLFSQEQLGEASLTFPGYNSTADTHDADPEDVNLCDIMAQIDTGNMDDMQDQADIDLPDKKPGTIAQPVWTCYISNHGVKDISNVGFATTPCQYDGHPTSPTGVEGNLLSAMTTDATNKTPKTGAEAYTDGKWSMERFLQTQEAIWEAEEKVLPALIAKICEPAFSDASLTITNVCAPLNTTSDCQLGTYVSKFSPHKFGYNTCSFWLTRFATETKKIVTRLSDSTGCDPNMVFTRNPTTFSLWSSGVMMSTGWGSAGSAAASTGPDRGVHYGTVANLITTEISPNPQKAWTNGYAYVKDNITGTVFDIEIRANYFVNPEAPPGSLHFTDQVVAVVMPPQIPVAKEFLTPPYVAKSSSSTSNNVVAEIEEGVLGVETAWCEITGWEYTKNDGTQGFAPAAACTNTNNNAPGGPVTPERTADPAGVDAPAVGPDGTVCGIPFTPSLVPNVSWPEQTVVYPGIEFLLQDGSIAPKYPTFYGALVYDLHLKKWGKYKGTCKGLLDYSPLNNESGAVVTTANFGMLAGVWKEDGFIYLFDDKPVDSMLTWGKIGFYRAGVTDIQEITFHFRKQATGTLFVDLSLDGRAIASTFSHAEAHAGVMQKTIYPPYSGKWFNVGITGQFDVTDLILKGSPKGRR